MTITDGGSDHGELLLASVSGTSTIEARSGTHSPTLGKPIGLVLLPIADTAVGSEFEADIRGRAAKARIVPTPFYKRKKEVAS